MFGHNRAWAHWNKGREEREKENSYILIDDWCTFSITFQANQPVLHVFALLPSPKISGFFQGCGKRGLGARLAAWRSCDCWCRRGWVVWMRWLVCWLFFSKGIKHSLGPVHLLFLNTILWSTTYTVQLSQQIECGISREFRVWNEVVGYFIYSRMVT